MPRGLLEAYVRAMPRIRAQESLEFIRNVSVGTGSTKKEVARRIVRALKHTATQGQTRRAVTPQTAEQAKAVFGAMGIGIRRSRDSE